MSATKILWGQIIIVFLTVLAGVWGATQWTAAALAYQPELGPPWFEAFGWRVYPPPAFFWWWFSFDAYAPRIFLTGSSIAASGGFASITVAIGMSVWRARELKNAETYGSARWASEREVRAAGLLGPNGVVLGRLARDYLRHDGPEHKQKLPSCPHQNRENHSSKIHMPPANGRIGEPLSRPEHPLRPWQN